MRRITNLLIVASAIMLASCGKQPAADLLFTNGVVYTVDHQRSQHEAIAITDGVISFVGSDADAEALIDTGTRVVDLKGRLMLPGLQDTHIHPIMGGVEALTCDLNAGASATEYVAIIKAYADANPDLPWITGGGWLMSAFGPGGMPSKALIDEVVPDRPVMLSSTDGHSGWANSRALELAGITADTPDPVDGRIDRDPTTGEPLGSLQEGAMSLVEAVMPELTPEQRMEGLRYAVGMLHAYGITAVQDAIVSADDLLTYQALANQEALNLHVEASLWWERDRGAEQISEMVARRKQFSHGLLRANTVKIMQDGVMENYTAVMLEPYQLDQPDVTGIPMVQPELLKKVVTQLDEAGFQVHFHAIGNGAIRQSLDALEAAREQNGAGDHRHHISHLQIIHPDDIPRFAELDVTANFQPLWAYADEYINELTLPYISQEAADYMYPINSVLQQGGRVAFGSDWSVSTANPWAQIEVAVSRKDPLNADSDVFMPEERITLKDAIAAFTINAAFVNHLDATTGSIEVGKRADLVVLSQNLFNIPAEKISDTEVLLTLFNGTPVFGDLSLTPLP